MSSPKFRWSKVYESSEEELQDFLQSRGLNGQRTHAEAFSDPVTHTGRPDEILWCAEGSLQVLTDDQKYSLQPGDALRLTTGETYQFIAGISGYGYYLTN